MATNNNRTATTNTKILQIYNSTAGEDSSTLSLGFWKDYVSVNINPILPEEERVNGKLYNYEKTASFIMSIDALFQLYTGIKLLERSIKEKNNKIFSIAVKNENSKSILKIGAAGEYEGIDDYYLAILTLNEKDEVDGNIFYIFTQPESGLLINYDESINSFKNKNINTQWELFKKFIDYAVNGLINGTIHGSNNFNFFRFNKIEDLLNNGTTKSSTPQKATFAGTRRRRNSITSTLESEENEIDRDEMFSEMENDTEFEIDDVDIEEDEIEKDTPKKTTKKSTKKTTKKSPKTVSIEEIANDMVEDLDELDDID